MHLIFYSVSQDIICFIMFYLCIVYVLSLIFLKLVLYSMPHLVLLGVEMEYKWVDIGEISVFSDSVKYFSCLFCSSFMVWIEAELL